MNTLLTLLIVIAAIALLVALVIPQLLSRKHRSVRPPRRNGLRRHWRKVYLLPVGIHRLIGWLPGQRLRPQVQFANIGQGIYENGIRSYIPDAATTARYLLYKKGTDTDHCAITGAGDDPLGPSEDQAAADGVPIAIKLLGAVKGTVFVVTDGTVDDGEYVKCGANGKVTQAATGDLSFGRAIIPTDCTKADGDVITIIPMAPAKYAF